MESLNELESLIASAKLEYNIECEKLHNLEYLYSIAVEKEQKYIYLIHDINENNTKPYRNEDKYTIDILHASYLNDCDYTELYESIKVYELYLVEIKHNKLLAHNNCMTQQTIVNQAIKIIQDALYIKESIICKSIEKIMEKYYNLKTL